VRLLLSLSLSLSQNDDENAKTREGGVNVSNF
jgi:hypothetical protein